MSEQQLAVLPDSASTALLRVISAVVHFETVLREQRLGSYITAVLPTETIEELRRLSDSDLREQGGRPSKLGQDFRVSFRIGDTSRILDVEFPEKERPSDP